MFEYSMCIEWNEGDKILLLKGDFFYLILDSKIFFFIIEFRVNLVM